MIEFQSRVATLAASILAALKGAPFCLPPAAYGVQLQNVTFESVRVAHDAPTTETILYHAWQELDPHPAAIDTLQTQIIVRCNLGFVPVSSIQATPNALAPAEVNLSADIVMDFDGRESMGDPLIVRARTRVRFDALTVTAASLPPWLKAAINAWIAAQVGNGTSAFASDIAKAEAWATAQLGPVLPPANIPFSLDSLFPSSAPVANVGLSVNDAHDCLSLRAEALTSSDYTPLRWKTFLNGHFDSALAANDWAVVMPAKDLELTLQTQLWGAMLEAMGSEAWRLVTLEVHYSAPQPNVARFTITPWLNIPVWGVDDAPIKLELSFDPIKGRLQVDLDAYGVRELVDDITFVLSVVLSIVLPLVGVLAVVALHEAVADLEAMATNAIATAGSGAVTDLNPAAQFEALPGPPLRFRASLPLALPQGIPGAINELRALPDRVAVAGSWGLLHWRDAQLTIDVGQFGWHVPSATCSGLDSLIRTLQQDSLALTYPEAWIELGSTGTAPITVCGVDVLDDGGAPGGVKVAIDSSRVPVSIGVSTSAAFASLPGKRAVRLAVRTSAGVFHALLAPPAPLTDEARDLLVDILSAVRRRCDVALGPWFDHLGRFKLDWIEDPLLDPDPDRRNVGLNPEIVRIEVQGLPANALLTLGSAAHSRIAQVSVQPRQAARLSFWTPRGQGVESLWLDNGPQADGQLDRAADTTRESVSAKRGSRRATPERSLSLTRQRLTPLGRVLLPSPAHALCGAPAWGGRFFALALEQGCALVDAGERGAPRVVMRWPFPGLRGVLPTRQGLLAWGEAGVLRIVAGSMAAPQPCCRHQAVRAAAAGGAWLALLYGDGLAIANAYGGEVARHELPDVRSVGFAGAALVTATSRGVRSHRVSRSGHLDSGETLLRWGAQELIGSPATRSLFARDAQDRWLEIAPDGQAGAAYAELPWEAQTAMAGPIWARLSAPTVLETYHAGPLVPAAPRGARPTHAEV